MSHSGTVSSLHRILHDLKNSNYFRVWGVLYLAVFILFWVGFGTYVSHVGKTSTVYATGFKPLNELAYPSFHLRVEGFQWAPNAIVVNSIQCAWNNTPVAIAQCQGCAPGGGKCYSPVTPGTNTNCFAVDYSANRFARAHQWNSSADLFEGTHLSSWIWCNFTIDNNALAATNTPNWVAWEQDGWTSYTIGDSGDTPIFFPPWGFNQVLLEPFTVQGVSYWERYHEFIPTPTNWTAVNPVLNTTTFAVATAMSTTTVTSYNQFGLNYRSWNALADIGGLAFGLWLMQTVAILLVGFILPNDSIFLQPWIHHGDSAYGDSKTNERTSLVS